MEPSGHLPRLWQCSDREHCSIIVYHHATPPARVSLAVSALVSIVGRRRISTEKKSFGFGALNKLFKLMSCVRIALLLSISFYLSLSFSCCCVPHSAQSPPGNALHKIIGDFHIDLCIRLVVHWLLLGCSSSSIFSSISNSSRGSANVLSKPDQRLKDW